MSHNAVVKFSLLLLLFTIPSVTGTTDILDPARPGGQFVVQLHRQRVPVKGQSDTVSYKNVYFGTVYIGGPSKQEFSVVFDTGSGHVVVPSTACKSKTCRIHRRYKAKASSSAVDVDYDGTLVKPGQPRDQITVAYGTGEVTGQFVADRVCLSDLGPAETKEAQGTLDIVSSNLRAGMSLTADPATVQQPLESQEDCLTLRVVTATEMTEEPFKDFSFDGILGLGLEALTLAPEFSFFGQMVAQGKVAKPMFGVFLADSEDEQSDICFGGYLPERLKTDLQWSPVALPELGYWQVQIHGIRVGNKSLDFCNDGQCRAVVDTGTSLLAVPSGFATELKDELSSALQDPPSTDVHGDAGQVIDCKKAEGALLHFDIEGLTVSLSAGDYARPAVMLHDDDSNEAGSENSHPHGQQTAPDDLDSRFSEAKCQPTILPIDMPAPIGPKVFIWGEPVLRKFYTVYDLAQKKIGFGVAIHEQHDSDIPRKATQRPLLTV